MKCYIIAGEASGDLHASNLMKAISRQASGAEFRVWGGDLMEQAGGTLVKHYRDLAFMGFLEVAVNLPAIMSNLRLCKLDIWEYDPDVIVFVDYPGFNLRIAEWARDQGFKIIYYISPQVWAWNTRRVRKIKKMVDRMLVILPFEADFYKKYKFNADFVGHPLLDAIAERETSSKAQILPNVTKPIIALLPGSRKQEIGRMLKVMLQVVERFSDYQFVVAGAPAISADFYKKIIGEKPVILFENQTYDLLEQSEAALVTSGTATMETALFDVPQVVCYQGNDLSFAIAKRLVKVNYISLVNLVAEKEVVKELIQKEFKVENLERELKQLFIPENRENMLADYKEIKKKLGGKGASENAAKIVVSEADLFRDI